jgi:hypothetical protein
LLRICNMVSSFRKSHAFQVLVLFM